MIQNVITALATVNQEPFKSQETIIICQGWKELYSTEKNESKIKNLQKGMEGEHFPELKTLKTKPPKPFTESSLLKMMETAGRIVDDEELREALKAKGLGTPATRAAIVEVLIKRKYIARRKKELISTDAGRGLIGKISDSRLKSPELTGEWEAILKKMEKGGYQSDKFMNDIAGYIEEIVKGVQLDLGNCPKCQAKIIEGKRGYGCSRWRDGCQFVLWKESENGMIDKHSVKKIIESM